LCHSSIKKKGEIFLSVVVMPTNTSKDLLPIEECPNKRFMMVIDNGNIEFESGRCDCEKMTPLEDSEGDELTLPVEES
jgi:hypothetical protein